MDILYIKNPKYQKVHFHKKTIKTNILCSLISIIFIPLPEFRLADTTNQNRCFIADTELIKFILTFIVREFLSIKKNFSSSERCNLLLLYQ